jgi:hypothetical protein
MIAWLKKHCKPAALGPLTDWRNWIPSVSSIEKTIANCNCSAPGPDGIPFIAYKRVHTLAANVFHSLFLDLLDVDNELFEPPIGFNHAWLALNLPTTMTTSGRFTLLRTFARYQS